MRRILALLALLSAAPLVPALARADTQRHFAVVASFVPARKAGGVANVAVSFRALDPDLRLNESPAPRLTLDLEQAVLLDKQPPRSVGAQEGSAADYDPLTARYHDLTKPVLFPVAIAPTAPRGERLVKARLVFFYCSQREAWCRRGTSDLEIPVFIR